MRVSAPPYGYLKHGEQEESPDPVSETLIHKAEPAFRSPARRTPLLSPALVLAGVGLGCPVFSLFITHMFSRDTQSEESLSVHVCY